MSMFKIDVRVGNLDGGDLAPVQTGRGHGGGTLDAAGVFDDAASHRNRNNSWVFILADGSRVKYGYGFALFRIGDYERPCPVIFGPDGNYLLGASTLEAFNLVVDPVGERLAPAEWLSLGWGGSLEN